MDEGMLNDLLECSVCLERLDTSSKVLPCQHTFCKKCLEDIVETNKELRCPECRVLVDSKIEELPPNVLLMRILEGMRNAAPKKQQIRTPVRGGPVNHFGTPVHHSAPERHVPKQHTPIHHPHQPFAKAVYDYMSKEPGDLSFKKGDLIMLRKRIDTHWFHGECNGKEGVFPLSYVQIMTPMVSHSPQCKALYDFRMTNDDEEGCLTFNKGEVISVIRRVDENWAEGKLDDRIGIFPLAFVELNSLARSLMKLSSNAQPGPSRVAPPTPTTEDSTPLIPTDHSQQISSVPATRSDSSSTVSSGSTTTPNTSSSNTSSSSSTAPSSPASPPPRAPRAQGKEKRHSFTSATTHQHQSTHRHSAEIVEDLERFRLPAAYIALYPYKPQKCDELELRKGGIYMVTERCQDGWFKGTSNRTQKCGVFPGNYVTLARSLPKNPQEPKITMSYTRTAKNIPRQIHPPELPPRSISPSISSSWHGQPEMTTIPLGRSQSAVMAGTSAPVTVATPQGSPTSDKCKERKEKSTVSLMRRLTSIKKPKSPPPASYSMDNPVFQDSSANIAHSVHVRSGSCPSQLLQAQPSELPHRLLLPGGGSQRIKHKERTPCAFNYNRTTENAASGGPSASPVSQHRKSNSLDAGKTKSTIVPSERFRCIVPYPPNTEYELELQINDIIYVHKKRDDGWYKGTLQRTGRTGLFPASFVESF